MPDKTRATISATQMPALLGTSKYLTHWMLYQEFANNADFPNPENNRMSWGRRMQGLLLEVTAEELKFEVHPNEADHYIRRGLLGCTRDGEIICPDRGPGAVETKCVFDYGVWMNEWEGGKKPPIYHEAQLQAQMYVGDGTTPFKWGVLAAWIGGEMKYYERKPIPELWDAMEKAAAQFFDDVANKREPSPTGVPMEVPMLTKLFPTQKGVVMDLSHLTHEEDPAGAEDAIQLAEKVRLLDYHSTQRLGHEKAEKDIKALLQARMAGAEELLLPSGIKATAKTVSRKGYEVKPSTYTTVSVYVPEAMKAGGEI